MRRNNSKTKREMPESAALIVLLKTLFTSPLLPDTEKSKFLQLKKQFPFYSEDTVLILNAGSLENIIFRPKKETNPFLFFQLLFTLAGRKKLYEAFWK